MIRVVLVDDEEYALDMLEILLGEIGNVTVAGKFKNPLKMLEEINHINADAIFMDIDMPGIKGNDAARRLSEIKPDLKIVFTTAYAEYALEAFEIKAMDYLLKPIKLERLRNSVERIQSTLPKHIETTVLDEPMIVCMGDFSIHSDLTKNGILTSCAQPWDKKI